MQPDSSDTRTVLFRVVQELAFARNQVGVTQVVKRAARQLTGSDGVTFVLRDGDSCHYVDEDAIAPLWKGQRFPAATCISGWAMIRRQIVVIEDIYCDDRIPLDAYRPTFVKSLVMVPVRSQDPIAAIGVYWAARHRTTTDEVNLLQTLADTAAVAIDNIQLFEALELRARESSMLLDQFRKEVEKREQVEEQLRQSQRLESIGRLAGGVAHDFNNLLTVIGGNVELGSLGEHVPRHSLLAFEEIREAASRAARLTRQLLAFSRNQLLQPQVVQLNTIVDEMNPMIRRLIGSGIDVKTNLATDLGHARVDPGQVEQVLMNLVVNARDAMPTGGRLTIETGNASLSEDYAKDHFDVTPGQFVMLAVSDNGTGMDAETLHLVFEPFFSTKPRDKGTGLGLSTVYGIVKQSGGHILVHSEPDRGATFKVYLPRVDQPLNACATHGAASASLLPATRTTILLVDDEPALLPILRAGLVSAGFDVLTASNGHDALSIAAAHDGEIAAVVTDLVMPGMSGAELADRLRADRPDVGVLFVSGFAENAANHHGFLSTGMGFLQKPFTPSDLAKTVVSMLAGSAPTTAARND